MYLVWYRFRARSLAHKVASITIKMISRGEKVAERKKDPSTMSLAWFYGVVDAFRPRATKNKFPD